MPFFTSSFSSYESILPDKFIILISGFDVLLISDTGPSTGKKAVIKCSFFLGSWPLFVYCG